MFTGIVESVGRVLSIESRGGALHLAVELGKLAEGTKPGDSIAVSGPCLTVAGLSGQAAHFDAVAETVGRTTLRDWRPGRKVNLERAVAAGGRLGGHFVTGHIDGCARVFAVRTVGGGAELDLGTPTGCGKYVAEKGSVALDGVSLTVARLLEEDRFRVALVPHTLGSTTLGELRAGDEVNFEADILARYAARLLGKDAPGGSLTEEKLREHGFM